jgi:hypothetical protein
MKQKCKDCEKYVTKGYNYCRMCGFHLTARQVQRNTRRDAIHARERFCGQCGNPNFSKHANIGSLPNCLIPQLPPPNFFEHPSRV